MCIYVGGSVNYRFFPTAFAAYSITGVGLKRTILLKLANLFKLAATRASWGRAASTRK